MAQGVRSDSDTGQIAAVLTKMPGVARVTPLAAQNGVSLIRLIPDSGPSDPATARLVHTLRDDRAAIEGHTGTHILIGGTTASNIDVSAKLSAALLSSDYEVFVISRIKEEFTRNGDARRAVQRGTTLSARVVTAAALIMFSIFVAFMFTNDPTIKAIGFSFAVGVFVDAFVVRLTLVPAVMAIIGSRIWYHPTWFGRHVPDPDIEGQRLEDQLNRGELVGATAGSQAPGADARTRSVR